MKIAVINFSGNVGKTMVTNHLLKTHMPENTVAVSVETVNDDDGAAERVRADHFGKIIDKVLSETNVLLDIGSSNAEKFINRMMAMRDSQDEIDLFLIPTTKDSKQQKDTVSTVRHLHTLGIPPGRMAIILNKHDPIDGDVREVFLQLFDFGGDPDSDNFNCYVSDELTVLSNEVYEYMRSTESLAGTSLATLAGMDRKKYQAMAKQHNADGDRSHCSEALSVVKAIMLAGPAADDMDAVWFKLKGILHQVGRKSPSDSR